MSSSDSSDEEELAKFREAADPEFFKDSLYKKTNQNESPIEKIKPKLKSQRYLDEGDGHYNDLKVSESMKEHIGKKLSKIIADQICFVDPEIKVRNKPKNEDIGGVKLFSDSKEFLSVDDTPEEPQIKRKKPKIKKRKIDEESLIDEEEKIQAASISSDDILSNKETKNWSKRSKGEVFEYKKAKDGVLNVVEPKSEFTEARNKNNWSESKISRDYESKKSKKKKKKKHQETNSV